MNNIDSVSEEFGIPVDEEGLACRECDLEDPDGNRTTRGHLRTSPGKRKGKATEERRAERRVAEE
jgi:hypothetical protein